MNDEPFCLQLWCWMLQFHLMESFWHLLLDRPDFGMTWLLLKLYRFRAANDLVFALAFLCYCVFASSWAVLRLLFIYHCSVLSTLVYGLLCRQVPFLAFRGFILDEPDFGELPIEGAWSFLLPFRCWKRLFLRVYFYFGIVAYC